MQRLKLDINPKGEIPVLHVAQYDKGRSFEVELVEGEDAYNVPSGYSVQLNVRKTDSKLVIKTPEAVVDNIITFVTTEQMTACAGNNIASLTLKDAADIVITTLYFIIEVQRDVIAGGLDSKSEIDNLTQQIEDIAQEVIGEDYYNKAQTDALLADKAEKSELPDMTDYYTKTQTDDLLNAKVDKTTLQNDYYDADYISTQFARKTFVENYVDATATASGNPCTFDTAKYHTLIPALTADIVCGGGGGTPSTPIPLVGHSELNLTVNGNTFTVAFGQTVYGGIYDKSGRLTITHGYILVDENTPTLQYNGSTIEAVKAYFDCTDKANGNLNLISDRFKTNVANEVGNVRGREHSNGVEFLLPLTVTHTTAGVKQWFADNNTQLAFELATPIVIDVPSISVFAENGTNNIISDCGGDVNVSYKDTIQHYIDQRLQ